MFASGFGSKVSTLSLITYLTPEDAKAALYSALAVLENAGHLIGDPSLHQIFAATLRQQFPPFWQALPFFVAAVGSPTYALSLDANLVSQGLYSLANLSTTFIKLDANIRTSPNVMASD